jgi:phosphoenolpyruvate-protein kinase (PTS system EI component)
MLARRLCSAQIPAVVGLGQALLRAAVGLDVRIMFPMIAELEEIRAAKAAVAEARAALEAQGAAVAKTVPLGIMVEIPSAAAKAIIRTCEVPTARRLAERALALDTAEAVRVRVRSELGR